MSGKFRQIINELAWVPKPFLTSLEWAVAKALVNDENLQRNIVTYRVPLENIEPTQHRLDLEKVRRFETQQSFDGALGFSRDVSIPSNMGDNRPRNGSLLEAHVYLWDGHHRFAAAQRAGQKYLKMKVFNLTDQLVLAASLQPGMTLGMFTAQLGVPDYELIAAMDSHDRLTHEHLNEVKK